MPSDSRPINPTRGNGLAVFGNCLVTSGFIAEAVCIGGSSMTSVIATSSPVGLTAVTGASFNATTGGSSTAFSWLW